ncbi:MAG TPA: hypothetical protein VLG92_06015 [Candidatus Saccharimonadia bacterium]|nr:hypothetical protein [Candidatus Saccharimonadia bacterium]
MARTRTSQEKPPSSKVTFKHAVRTGVAGEVLGAGASRTKRVVRALASVAVGNPTQNAMRKEAAGRSAAVNARVGMAEASAQGNNRGFLGLLKRSERLPREGQQPGTMYAPAIEGSYSIQPKKGGNGFELATTDTTWKVSRNYLINGAESRSSGDTRLQAPDGQQPLQLEVVDPSGEARKIKVDRVRVRYEAPATVSGERFDTDLTAIGSGRTIVTINERPYDPDHPLRGLDWRDASVNDEVEFSLGPDGQMDGLAFGRNNRQDLTPIEGATANVDDFLHQMAFLVDGAPAVMQLPQYEFV